MVVRYKAESKCECRWFYKETLISESSMMKVVHEKKESFYECRLQITVNFTFKLGSVYPAVVAWSVKASTFSFGRSLYFAGGGSNPA